MRTEKRKNIRTKKRKGTKTNKQKNPSASLRASTKTKKQKNLKAKKREVVYAFIDSQNLNLSIKSQGWNLDFAKFKVYLEDKFRVKKALLFIGYIPTNQRLYKFLEKSGYKLVFKPTVLGPKETVKGNVDAELVLHCMIEYEKFDKAVIVTGDGDFYCLIDYLLDKEKLSRLVVPNKYRFSSLLRSFMKHITFLNRERNNLERKKRHNP
jgi:uncharacterized LabA/DUF88 family protein